MVLLASAAGLSSPMSSSWPGQKNPFQNAPGPFIYALPNLAGTRPFSCSSDTALFCSFSGAGDSDAPAAPPDSSLHHHHHHRCCCHHDPPSPSPSKSAEPPIVSTKEEGAAPGPDTESPLPPPPMSASDEIHFELGDVISSPCLIESAGIEPEQQTEQQRQEPQSQASVPSTVTPGLPTTPTPTHSNALSSSTESDSQEGQREGGRLGVGGDPEEEVRENLKRGGGRRKKRRRNRKQGKGRSRPEHHGVGSIAPRFMALSGIHYGLWPQYGVCHQAPPPPPPPAMNHHAWSFAGYHHHQGGFVVPPTSPTPLFWNPIVPALGFVGVPVA